MHYCYYTIDMEGAPQILRRLGSTPSHVNCDCKQSFKPGIFLTPNGDFAVVGILAPVEDHPSITEAVKSMTPHRGGGVGEGERVAQIDRQTFLRSAALAYAMCGVVSYIDGSQQEPLFFIAPDKYPERLPEPYGGSGGRGGTPFLVAVNFH